MTKQFVAALLTAVASATTRVGVLSDLHFNQNYNPASSASYCMSTGVE
jgi:hypothetical protein